MTALNSYTSVIKCSAEEALHSLEAMQKGIAADMAAYQLNRDDANSAVEDLSTTSVLASSAYMRSRMRRLYAMCAKAFGLGPSTATSSGDARAVEQSDVLMQQAAVVGLAAVVEAESTVKVAVVDGHMKE